MPRQAAVKLPSPGAHHEGYSEERFSITITKGNQHIPSFWFDRMQDWLATHSVKCGMGQEQGEVKKQLHLQIYAVISAPPHPSGSRIGLPAASRRPLAQSIMTAQRLCARALHYQSR